MKRCLIISAGVGGGHVRAADALVKWFARLHPEVIVRHVDALEYVTEAMRIAYVVPYLEMVSRLPEVWGYLYKRSQDKKIDSKTNKIRSIASKMQAAELRSLIEEFHPDHIIATHFLPLDVLTTKGGKRRWPVPVSTVITDYGVHSFWMREWVDRYFVANEECATAMVRRGFDAAKVQITGLPIDPAFADAAAANDLRDSLSTDEGAARPQGVPSGTAGAGGRRLNVLLMGGGFGMGHMVKAAKHILGWQGEDAHVRGRRVRLVAVAGRNAETHRELLELRVPFEAELEVKGFIDDVQNEMAKADVLVSKAGGLTVTEALTMGLPMFLLDPIPGQEEHNADYLLEEGAAKAVGSLESLEFKLDRALSDPVWVAKMRERARAIRRPGAGKDVIEAAMKMVNVAPTAIGAGIVAVAKSDPGRRS
jgi:processive 1,2-diacylglycerol beta-glucosyltransferase